jgi:hypothetical protein
MFYTRMLVPDQRLKISNSILRSVGSPARPSELCYFCRVEWTVPQCPGSGWLGLGWGVKIIVLLATGTCLPMRPSPAPQSTPLSFLESIFIDQAALKHPHRALANAALQLQYAPPMTLAA